MLKPMQPPIDLPGTENELWDTYKGGGGACLEAEFNLSKNHVLAFLVGSVGSHQGSGGSRPASSVCCFATSIVCA